MTRLKVCGMRSLEDLERCHAADYLGFVVMADSPNELGMREAAALMSSCGPRRVAVTTEARPERLRALVRALDPDVLQLHTPQYPEALRAAGDLGVPVWGMMAIGPGTVGPPSLEGIEALVLDSPGPRAGGNGRPHDWARSGEVREALAPFPVVLAGGLGPENAALAIRTVRPYALDVSSGVSGEGGKDPEKVRELIAAMRGALE